MKKHSLAISKTMQLDLGFVTSTQVILAQKGKGKSYTAAVEAEELLELKQQVVIIDPTGAHWGLRSSADGKSAGYSIVVFGGEHGDVELAADAGEVVANAIAAEHFSAIIDLSLFRKGEALRFMAIFLETLYRKNREPLHLFIDEADVVAPQKAFGPEQARVLGACEDVVRRGRIRGIGCTLITQRPQVLNKDVLTQADMLTTLGMNHPKDLGAIEAWVAVHGDPEKARTMITSLPSLPKGDAWVWNPSVDLFKRVTIRERRTFDSGRTPKPGERAIAAKVLAPVDIEALGAAIADTVKTQRENDPKALKAELERMRLEQKRLIEQASYAKPVKPAKPTKVIDPKKLAAIVARLEKRAERYEATLRHLFEAGHGDLDTMRAAIRDLRPAGAVTNPKLDARGVEWSPFHAPIAHRELRPAPSPGESVFLDRQLEEVSKLSRAQRYPTIPPAKVSIVHRNPKPVNHRDPKPSNIPKVDGALPPGEVKILSAAIQFGEIERKRLGVLTGYKKTSRDSYVARLVARGFLITANGGVIIPTIEGRAELPNYQPLPTGAALYNHWAMELPPGEKYILDELMTGRAGTAPHDSLMHGHTHGSAIPRDRLGVGKFQKTSRDSYITRLAAKGLVVIGRGEVAPSPELFS